MSSAMLGLIVCIVVAAGAAMIWGRMTRPVSIPTRPELAIDEIWRQYYAEGPVTRGAVQYAFDLVARTFGVRPGQLRPTDRFDAELRIRAGWAEYDSPLDELSEELRAMKRTDSPEISRIETVDDVVHFVAAARAYG